MFWWSRLRARWVAANCSAFPSPGRPRPAPADAPRARPNSAPFRSPSADFSKGQGMKKIILGLTATIAAATLAVVPASAHRQWMLPSATVLSGDDVWVTVDAAISNDLFYFEHHPKRLDSVKAWAPDGSEAPIENQATGRYRSTFDVHLTQKGTWRIASLSEGLMEIGRASCRERVCQYV